MTAGVSKLWSRTRKCGTGVFTKSHCWIWVRSQGRTYLWLIYLYSVCSGQYMPCPVCPGCSRSWNNCVMSAKSGITALRPMGARSVGRRLSWTCVSNYHLELAQLWRCPVYHMERYATRLCGPLTSGTSSAIIRENFKPGKMVSTVDCQASDVERRAEPAYVWCLYRLQLFSECGTQLVHHYRVFARGISHISLCRSHLTNLRTFITQSEAVGRGHDKDPAQLSPVHKGSDSPRSIRQRDSDEESPCCKACRAHPPHKLDVPAVPVSPMAASSRDLRLFLNDGRPAILPVSIRMPDLVGDNVLVSVGLPSVIAPPGDTASSSGKV